MELIQKRIFLKEVDGDGRYIALDSVTMYSYHIEEVNEHYFDGVIFAHCGVDKICISRDDESNYEDLENRLTNQIEQFISACDFDALTEAIKAFEEIPKA